MSKYTKEEETYIDNVRQRRKFYDEYLSNKTFQLFTCPGCGFPTLTSREEYDICNVCNWEDEQENEEQADEVLGSPNYDLSLNRNRINIERALQDIVKKQTGAVITDPDTVITILNNHKIRMLSFDSKISYDTDINDPIGTIRKELRVMVLQDLVVPKNK